MIPRDSASRVEIMGTPVDSFTMEETVSRAIEYIQANQFAHFIGVNADKLLQMRDDPVMDEIVRRCEVVNADGASMLIAANRLNIDIPERVAGVDLMYELCSVAQNEHFRVYLLGAKQEVVDQAKIELEKTYPALCICGVRNGYFSENEYPGVAKEVIDSCANIIFVGITSPKKEKVIEYFRQLGMKGVFVGVGGTFDVVSGNIPRAPKIMQRLKMEWLFRMFQEPKRLAKRYFVGNARFMRLLMIEEKKQKKGAQR